MESLATDSGIPFVFGSVSDGTFSGTGSAAQDAGISQMIANSVNWNIFKYLKNVFLNIQSSH